MEHGAGDVQSDRDGQGGDRETRGMEIGESGLDTKDHAVVETLFIEERIENGEGVSTSSDGLRRRAAEDVSEIFHVKDGTASVEGGFVTAFAVSESGPEPELTAAVYDND